MKKTALIIFLLIITGRMLAQPVFKAIAPQDPVVSGESFRIQYIAEETSTISNFAPPSFKKFRVVNGPEQYTGNIPGKGGPLVNTVYTLQAMEPGRYQLDGAVTSIGGKVFQSNDVWITVISREEAQRLKKPNGYIVENPFSFLKPGEDPKKIVQENLFVRLTVDKKTCYNGQPIVATFKLYSRLQSRSDIIKNPGLYGFTVQDMVSLGDKVMTVEKMNGKLFDVHTIRQVQLYPLQSGEMVIDEMEIKNRVEFSRSAISKRTEQQIVEGVFDEKSDEPSESGGVEIIENIIHTEPVKIMVKPLPVLNKPSDFAGATGRFSIDAGIERKEMAKNEEGYLVITVRGKGNFAQISSPEIDWPSNVEGFEPTVSTSLDKMSVPLAGSKSFRYAFVSSTPGNYQIPAVRLSYYDPDTNKYKTVSSAAIGITVTNQEKIKTQAVQKEGSAVLHETNRRASMIAASIVIGGVLVVLLYWLFQKRQLPSKEPAMPVAKEKPVYPGADAVLQSAYLLLPAGDREFYGVLYHALWSQLALQFNLSGSEMNKQVLAQRVQSADRTAINELLRVLEQCEAGMFTNVSFDEDREQLLQNVKGWMDQVMG